jgi:hypothetical protein
MKLADRILLHLLKYGRKDPSEIMIPNFYHFMFEMDCFKLTKKQYVIEYEVKISRADYKNDFSKSYGQWRGPAVMKHDQIAQCKTVNSFYFVVPENLIGTHEVPAYAGLMYFRPKGTMMPATLIDEAYATTKDDIYTIKPAPLLHKNKFEDFQELCKSLSWREDRWRRKFYKE